jgi:hypothetical protein
MAFRAVHAEWGAVFAHLPDLGCGQTWEAVWKVRPPAPLTCDECGHPMFAKVSYNGLQFFAHAPGAPHCALALETLAHHLLKLELANAARDAGAHAEMEVRGPDNAWRADVLASDPASTWRMALEAQLSPITAAEITGRTERMNADAVSSIWFSDRPRPPWLGVVPSVRLARPDDSEGLAVAAGLMRWDGSWQDVPAALVQFLGWAFAGRVVPYTPRVCVRERLATIWTAPHYVRAFDDYLAELERQAERERRFREARIAARERKRDEIRRKNAATRIAAVSEAAKAEWTAHGTEEGGRWRVWAVQRPGVRQLIGELSERDIPLSVGWSTGDPRYAGGIPLVTDDGALGAVFNPIPRRVRGGAFLLLAGTPLLFPSEESRVVFEQSMEKAGLTPLDGWWTDVADGGGSCTCAAPQLVMVLVRRKYRAEPSETRDPASLGHAECEACGRWYSDGWRLAARKQSPASW